MAIRSLSNHLRVGVTRTIMGAACAAQFCRRLESLQKAQFSSLKSAAPANQGRPRHWLAFAAGLGGGALGTYLAQRVHNKQSIQKDAGTEPLDKRLKPYFDLLEQHTQVLGPMGEAAKGEIEIVRDPQKIATIEKETGQKVGILAENKYHMFIVDAVKFPNGTNGVYGRFFWKQSLKGPSGAAVLPLLPNGKFLLILIYRHPLRKWVIEIPRGNGEGAELLKNLIKRELKEETGAEVSETIELGKINSDSGMTLGGTPLVLAKVSKFGNHQRDDAETSISLISLSPAELNDAIKKGSLPVTINGKIQEVEIGRDSFMLAALKLYDLHKASKG